MSLTEKAAIGLIHRGQKRRAAEALSKSVTEVVPLPGQVTIDDEPGNG